MKLHLRKSQRDQTKRDGEIQIRDGCLVRGWMDLIPSSPARCRTPASMARAPASLAWGGAGEGGAARGAFGGERRGSRRRRRGGGAAKARRRASEDRRRRGRWRSGGGARPVAEKSRWRTVKTGGGALAPLRRAKVPARDGGSGPWGLETGLGGPRGWDGGVGRRPSTADLQL